MILSLALLKEYLPGLTASPEELARRLTLSGTAVERILPGADGAMLFETEITSNRPDLLSYLGVAREVAALYGLKVKRPQPALVEDAETTASAITVAIEAPERCGRYTARVVRGSNGFFIAS